MLQFSIEAWRKMAAVYNIAKTEVGMFGISSKDNPLYVEDVVIIDQDCTSYTTEFDDEALADYVDDMFDKGKEPCECLRIWIHTHPGMKPSPSGQDEKTFEEKFGSSNWAVMVILGSNLETYAELYCKDPCPHNVELETEIDYGYGVDEIKLLGEEIKAKVTELVVKAKKETRPKFEEIIEPFKCDSCTSIDCDTCEYAYSEEYFLHMQGEHSGLLY